MAFALPCLHIQTPAPRPTFSVCHSCPWAMPTWVPATHSYSCQVTGWPGSPRRAEKPSISPRRVPHPNPGVNTLLLQKYLWLPGKGEGSLGVSPISALAHTHPAPHLTWGVSPDDAAGSGGGTGVSGHRLSSQLKYPTLVFPSARGGFGPSFWLLHGCPGRSLQEFSLKLLWVVAYGPGETSS